MEMMTDETRATVLIADPDAERRRALAERLGRHGFTVSEAANGLEALLHVKRHRPTRVVLDVSMPRLGGLEALKRIRTFDPSIIVLIVTGEADARVHGEARALGAHAVLSKPVPIADLLALLGSGAPPAVVPGIAAAPASSPAQVAVAHVLVVDDDADVRAMLEEFLAEQRYAVRSVADGPAAVRAIVEAAPDIVLLDIDMPGLKGTEALPALRALAPRAVVIMVSGTADEELARRTLAHGAFDYVTKPVDLGYLAQSLETALTMNAI